MDYQRLASNYLDPTDEPWEWLLNHAPFAADLFRNCRVLKYATAIHEAAHAVLNEHFEYRVKSISIQGGNEVTETESQLKPNPTHIFVILHAAYVAEVQVINKRYVFDHANTDRDFMHQLCASEKFETKQIREMYRQSEQLVEQNWNKILAVANMLAERQRLSGDEVRKIIT